MSLHTLANHLQSAGRGEDKVLVHMTPGEVNGLQSLAMSQGGSLTINPETGLPEAGILSSLLPIVAGAFLGPAGLGLTAMQTGLAVGALGTAATGSLGKGLMMGFGAYGGAGLGEGLMSAGASAMPNAAGNTAAGLADDAIAAGAKVNPASFGGTNQFSNYAANTGANAAANTGSVVNNVGGLNAYTPASPFANTPQGINAGNYQLPNGTYAAPPAAPTVTAPPVTPTSGAQLQNASMSGVKTTGTYTAPTPVSPAPSTAPVSNWDKVAAGAKDVTSSGTKAWEFVKAHPSPFIGVGVGALQEMQEQKAKDAANAAGSGSPGMIRPYEYSVAQNQSAYAPSASTAERKYFVEPRFIAQTPYAAKEGGLTSLAVGGQVEQMSAENAVSGNTMYPQSQIQTSIYSNPMMSRPMPNNVINSGIDAPVDPYSGEMKMAGGGTAATAAKAEPTTSSKYTYDPATMKYTETTTTTPANNGVGAWGGGSILNPGPGTYGGMNSGSGTFGNRVGSGPASLALQQFYGGTRGQQAPQPTTMTETLGGISEPYMQPAGLAAAPQQIIPNIPMQPQQDVNQQLGLQAFYPMMEQQLAAKGAQMQSQNMADGGMAGGGYNLGGYSDGGRLLRGPGDGVSDSIPASIGNRQPARLADGEFVVPARIVSEIGNGSTEAGARKLYAMMDRVQKARGKTTGKNKVAVNTKAEKLLPA